MRADAPRVLCQQPRVLGRVVHAVDHRIFEGNAPPGRLIISGAGVDERLNAAAAVGRHNLRASLVIRSVERDRECELQVARRQIIKALDKPARGQ